jgi:hypothetical protein
MIDLSTVPLWERIGVFMLVVACEITLMLLIAAISRKNTMTKLENKKISESLDQKEPECTHELKGKETIELVFFNEFEQKNHAYYYEIWRCTQCHKLEKNTIQVR